MQGVSREGLKGRDHLEDQVVGWKIIVKWTLREFRLRMRTRLICLMVGSIEWLLCYCAPENETSCYIKGGLATS